jgi:hypothetical protein
VKNEQLQAGTEYCIVDLGLNQWNSGYEFIGKRGADFIFKDTLEPPFNKEVLYSEHEMSDLLQNGAIAFEGTL